MERYEVLKIKYQEDAACVWECMGIREKFSCADTQMAALAEEIATQQVNRVALVSEDESERSVMLAKVCKQLAADVSWEVLPIICGSSERNLTAVDVIQGLILELERILEQSGNNEGKDGNTYDWMLAEDAYFSGINRQKLVEMQNRFAELCTLYHNQQDKKLLVALDHADKIFVGTGWDEIGFLPQMLSDYLSVIVSCSERLQLPESVTVKKLLAVENRETAVSELIASVDVHTSLIYGYLALTPLGLRVEDLAALLLADTGESDIERVKEICNNAVNAGLLAKWSEGRFAVSQASVRKLMEQQMEESDKYAEQLAVYLMGLPEEDVVKRQSMVPVLVKTNKTEELALYIIDLWNKKEKDTSVYTARVLCDTIRMDGGKWFHAFARAANELEIRVEDKRKLMMFMSFLVGDCFADSREELLCRRMLCDIVLEFAEKLVQTVPISENVQSCAMQYMTSGDVYFRLDGMEKPTPALKLYERAAYLFEELMRKEGTQHYNSLKAAFNNIQKIYSMMEGEEYEKKALDYMEREVIFSERMNAVLRTLESLMAVAESYIKLGDYLMTRGGKEKLEKALVCHKKALSIREAISEQLKRPIPELAESYCKTGVVLAQIGGEENMNAALHYREREAFLQERRVKAENALLDMRRLANAYTAIGENWLERKGVQNLEKAQKHFDKAYQVMEQVVARICTVSSMRDLYVSYYRLAHAYEYYQERDTLIASRHYYLQAASICEQINREVRSEESNEDLNFIHTQLSRVEARLERFGNTEDGKGKSIGMTPEEQCRKYRTEAAVYEDMGDRESLEKAVELYKAELSVTVKVADESTAIGCLELAEVYLRIGAAQEALGAYTDWKKAMQNYSAAVQMCYKANNLKSTTESQRKLATAYIYRSDCAKLLGNKEDILMAYEGYVQAKELREKVHAKLNNPQTKKELDYCMRQIAELKHLV